MLHSKDSVKGLTAHVENTPVKMGQAIATLVRTEHEELYQETMHATDSDALED
jgi:hypothetical protein